MLQHYVCPACRSPLKSNGSAPDAPALACSHCAEVFALASGIPILIPAGAYQKYPVQQVKDTYDRVYVHPEVMGTKLDPEYSRLTKTTLLEFCTRSPNPRILDLGTGDGDLWEFCPKHAEWHGIDISQVGVRLAIRRFPSLRGAVAISEFLPYGDHYFGAVIAADSIEHAFDVTASLNSVKRVLAPGGTFAFSVPTPNSLRKWGYNRLLRQFPSARLLFRLFNVLLRRALMFGNPAFQPIDRDMSLEGWMSAVRQAGFSIAELREWPVPPLQPIVYLLCARANA